jgi:hypothetical protein
MNEVSVRLVQVLDPFHSTEFWKKPESLLLQQSPELCARRSMLSVYSVIAEYIRLSFIPPTELWIVWENYMSYNSRKVEAQGLAHDLPFVHIIPRWDPNKFRCLSRKHFSVRTVLYQCTAFELLLKATLEICHLWLRFSQITQHITFYEICCITEYAPGVILQ